MRRILYMALFTASAAVCQPTIAPTEAQVGSRRGQDVDGYNVVNSFEVGYRWRDVNGDLGNTAVMSISGMGSVSWVAT